MADNKRKNEQIVPVETPNLSKSKESRNINTFLKIVFIIVLSIFVVIIWQVAEQLGNRVGNSAGIFAGTVSGSYDGITEGLARGYEDGREQGLSAEDTKVDIANKIAEVGKLDVLIAEDQFVDNFQLGEDYKALFVYKAAATFSVDLTRAIVINEESTIKIILPNIEVEFMIDEEESVKLAEWQKFFWSGSAEAGYIGYMNSMAQIKEKAASDMTNYEYLMQKAKESAKKQIKFLANSLRIEEKTIVVEFEGEK